MMRGEDILEKQYISRATAETDQMFFPEGHHEMKVVPSGRKKHFLSFFLKNFSAYKKLSRAARIAVIAGITAIVLAIIQPRFAPALITAFIWVTSYVASSENINIKRFWFLFTYQKSHLKSMASLLKEQDRKVLEMQEVMRTITSIKLKHEKH